MTQHIIKRHQSRRNSSTLVLIACLLLSVGCGSVPTKLGEAVNSTINSQEDTQVKKREKITYPQGQKSSEQKDR